MACRRELRPSILLPYLLPLTPPLPTSTKQHRHPRNLCAERAQAPQHCRVRLSSPTDPFLQHRSSPPLNSSSRLIEVVYHDDRLYMVFEYCDQDLKHYLAERKTPIKYSQAKVRYFFLLGTKQFSALTPPPLHQ